MFRAGLGIAISAVSIYLVTQAISVDDSLRTLGSANWQAIGIAAALLALDVAVRGLRWRALLTPIATLPRLTVLGHLLVGYLANNALPARLGELVRSFSLGDRERVSRSAIIGTVIVERLLDVGVLALSVLVALAIVSSASLLLVVAVSGLAIGVGGMALLFATTSSGPNARMLDRVPAGRIRSTVHGLINGFSVVRSTAALAEAFLLTAVAWALTAFAFAVAGASVGLDLNFGEAFLIAGAVNLATAIPAGPGYLGTFELAAVSVAAAIGVSPVAGLAMAMIVHLATLALTTAGGMGALAFLYLNPSTARMKGPVVEPVMAIVSDIDPRDPVS